MALYRAAEDDRGSGAADVVTVEEAVNTGQLDAVEAWLAALHKRSVLHDASRCPFIMTEVSRVVLMAVEGQQSRVLDAAVESMVKQGLSLQAKYAAALLLITSRRRPVASEAQQKIISRITPEDKALVLELLSDKRECAAALDALRDSGFIPSLTILQKAFDVAKKHMHYASMKQLMQQGLLGCLAGEWAATAAACQEGRCEEVTAIVGSSFEPILLAMVSASLLARKGG